MLSLRASNEGLLPFSPARPRGAETPRFPSGPRVARAQEHHRRPSSFTLPHPLPEPR